MKWQADKISELVSGYGELWSTLILSMLLNYRAHGHDEKNNTNNNSNFAYVDARRVIIIDEEADGGVVCWDDSKSHLENLYRQESDKDHEKMQQHQHLVVTGYVASNSKGVATTLQRDGSDYSAAIMGRLLQSTSITIWTDVDGVLSADPRRVPTAFPIPEVSFNEAMELAYFGAKVIHPKTMQPAITATPMIPIYIKNTLTFPLNNDTITYQHPGTRIFTSSTTHTDRERCVCGFSTIEDMALLNVEGSGMVGVKGVANRLFQALDMAGVNIVLISQASSEHSITFATRQNQADIAKYAIEQTFTSEISVQQSIDRVDVTPNCAIIAAVGDGMSHTAGVSGRFFSALGDAEINVLAIAQGSSERNISAVISMEESTRALRAVHAAFRLSSTSVRAAIVGVSAEEYNGITDIGQVLLQLLKDQHTQLCDTFDIDLQVCAVLPDSTSDFLVTLRDVGSKPSDTIDLTSYYDAIRNKDDTTSSSDMVRLVPGNLATLSQHVKTEECPHTVIFDCTADENVGKLHPKWLGDNIHVITANSTALSGTKELRQDIRHAETSQGKLSAKYLREVTVGGALPVISTLNNLLRSGDKIRRIDGIFSTSLSYILHRIAPPPDCSDCIAFDDIMTDGLSKIGRTTASSGEDPCSFSQAVDEARALGLMEEDPLKDLSNEYTARCLMVIAKELGIDQDFDVEQIQLHMSDMLMNDIMENSTTEKDTSYAKVADQLDRLMQERVRRAKENKCVPRHVSSIDVKDGGRIQIRIVDVPNQHLFAITPPSCECVRFFTENHKPLPLVIQGPSAGLHSTASGLLAELMRLMQGKVGTRPGTIRRTSSGSYLGK